VKLLVDTGQSGMDYCKSIGCDEEGIEGVGVPSAYWAHLGRVLGPKILELLEEEADVICPLGNWDHFLQELSYILQSYH
jgi:hypothetical protein